MIYVNDHSEKTSVLVWETLVAEIADISNAEYQEKYDGDWRNLNADLYDFDFSEEPKYAAIVRKSEKAWTPEKVEKMSLPATIWLVCEIDEAANGYTLRRTDFAGNWKAEDDRLYSAQEIADYLNEYEVSPEDVKTHG